MGAVTRSALVRRPVDEVAKVATDPDVVFPIMSGFGKFDLIAKTPDGSQEWDLYLNVGTIHVGGRVLVEPPSGPILVWRSRRGTRHNARMEVSPAEGGALMTLSVTVEFAGLLAGWLTSLLAQGILARHIEAGLEQLRHHIEFGT
jgi:carbon monoxide dehydrogenase subunit G